MLKHTNILLCTINVGTWNIGWAGFLTLSVVLLGCIQVVYNCRVSPNIEFMINSMHTDMTV